MDMCARGPRGRLLRKGRSSQANQVYIVTSATFHRAPLFRDLRLGRLVVRAFRYQSDCGRARTLAFVVMPDHFHWLFSLGTRLPLQRVVHSVKSYSAYAINAARKTPGAKIWQDGFHDHAVRRDETLQAISRYIVENPLRAGLVEDIGRYSLWDADWVG